MTNQESINIKKSLRTTLQILFWVPTIFFSLLLVKNTIPYFSFSPDFGFIQERIKLYLNPLWKYSFYIHIFAGMWCISSALLQFSSWILKKRKAIHVWSGRIYVFVVLFLGAPTGLYMAPFAKGGFWEKFLFVFMAVFWFFTTIKGLSTILNKKVMLHKFWMMRSYAMALTAVTFRIYHLVFFALGIDHHANYVISLWISVIGNMLIAEFFIYREDRNHLLKLKKIET